MITHGFVDQPGELRDACVTVFGDLRGEVSQGCPARGFLVWRV